MGALSVLEGIGALHGSLAVQLYKDLGKTHSFAGNRLQDSRIRVAGFDPQQNGHQDQAITLLTNALEMQRQLQGDEHKNTQNISRLLDSLAKEATPEQKL